MTRSSYISLACLVSMIAGCTANTSESQSTSSPKDAPTFMDALTFYASFDSPEADVAGGDPKLYSAASRAPVDSAVVGLGEAKDVSYSSDAGQQGAALRFGAKTNNVVFFKCAQNISYSESDWSGTVSFWLKLDPAVDLEPGFCDPIQITDVNYNDAAIWVDFTQENPRDFRLGVIGDLIHWNPNGVGPNDNPEFDKRLVVVDNPPFSRQRWTHIAITFEHLNTEDGLATLYVDGQRQGAIQPQQDPFTWDLERANMYLGLNYVGLYDELSVYNRALSQEEVKQLTDLSTSIKDLL